MRLEAAASRVSDSLRRLLHRKRSARGLILAYHRVVELASDPIPIAVSPRHFSEHLEVLNDQYRPLSLHGLVDSLRGGEVRERSVAVTFDDGYADNLHVAAPLLEMHRVPATMFVTAGMVGGSSEFWWDELEPLVLAPTGTVGRLELEIRGRRVVLEPTRESGGLAAGRSGAPAWNTLSRRDPTPRHAAYRILMEVLREQNPDERNAVLADLRRWSGATGSGRDTHRALAVEELPALVGHPLLEVGAHSVSHARLAGLSLEDQRSEIVSSKERLERLVGRPVVSFAYPFGAAGDYTSETIATVREAGFTRACANFPGVVEAGTDPLQLPRFLVRDWDGLTFARHLRRWLTGA